MEFFKLKNQLAYFVKSVLNQAKTILYEPPDWANYVALMFLFEQLDEEPCDRFIRLSPMIHIDDNTPEAVIGLMRSLYRLDMDITKDEEIDLIKQCFKQWKNGVIQNQPIVYKVDRNNVLEFKNGLRTFAEAMDLWEYGEMHFYAS